MLNFPKMIFTINDIRKYICLAALLIFIVPGLTYAGDQGNGLRKSKLEKFYFKSEIQSDTVRKARPVAKPPQKAPAKKTLDDLLKQARSNIKQVPRSAPKLKPQPVKEEVKVRSNSPSTRDTRRKPF